MSIDAAPKPSAPTSPAHSGYNYGLLYDPEPARWMFGWNELRIERPSFKKPAAIKIERDGHADEARLLKWKMNYKGVDQGRVQVRTTRRTKGGRAVRLPFEGEDLPVFESEFTLD